MNYTRLRENGKISAAYSGHELVIHHSEGVTMGLNREEALQLARMIVEHIEQASDIPTVAVIVEGGCVQDVLSTIGKFAYRLIDLDDAQDGTASYIEATPVENTDAYPHQDVDDIEED